MGELTLFTSSFLRHVATRASIDAVFQAVHNEVLSATHSMMRPRLEAMLNRPLVLVDRGGAPPPSVACGAEGCRANLSCDAGKQSERVAPLAEDIAVPEAGSAARRRDTSAEHSSNAGLATVARSVEQTTLPHNPNGYILSYGASYKSASTWNEVPQCPPSAAAVHDAFVSECGFSSAFPPTLDEDVTCRRMIEDVRRVATTMASHDVVVLFFTGHGYRMDDTTCLLDSVGSHVSVRKLQAVVAEAVMERELRDVSFVTILDCGQTTSSGELCPMCPMCMVVVACRRCGNGLPAGAGVADPSDNADELNVCVADATECSWFEGYATSPSTWCRDQDV